MNTQLAEDTHVLELTDQPASQPLAVQQHQVPAVAGGGPVAIAMQAMKAGMSIADMRALLDLQKDWEANEARKAYVADMAEFKKNPPEIFKRKAVGFESKDGTSTTSYMHATLGDVTSLTVEALALHGFSHRWDTEQRDQGQIHVTCILTHKLGHSERTMLNSSRDESGKKNNIQALASTVTYLQRYTLLAACGLATKDMEDDDGKKAGAGEGAYDAEATLKDWIGKAGMAINVHALSETRRMANADFAVAKDYAGWEAFKAVCSAKRAELEGGAA